MLLSSLFRPWEWLGLGEAFSFPLSNPSDTPIIRVETVWTQLAYESRKEKLLWCPQSWFGKVEYSTKTSFRRTPPGGGFLVSCRWRERPTLEAHRIHWGATSEGGTLTDWFGVCCCCSVGSLIIYPSFSSSLSFPSHHPLPNLEFTPRSKVIRSSKTVKMVKAGRYLHFSSALLVFLFCYWP